MNTLRSFFFRAWRPGLLTLSLVVIAYLLYFHNLAHLLPGYDARELKVYRGAADWHTILHNPANAPYKLALWLTIVFGHHSLLQTRLVAASFSIVAALLFYVVVYRWHGFRTAFLSTILFATSAGFLHVARLGSAQIMQMGILLFLAALLGYQHLPRHRTLVGYSFVAATAILAYTPGLIWLEVFGLVLVRRQLVDWTKSVGRLQTALSILLLIALLAPLGYAGYTHHAVLQNVAGLPVQLQTLRQAPANLGNALLAIGLRSSGDPEFFVGHAPLLDIIELVLAAIGGLYYVRHERTLRSTFLFGGLVLSLLLIALGGNVGTATLLPLLYLLVAAGLHSFTVQWLVVFPRNPVARSVGLGLICAMLFFSVLYQVRSYFVAWPHNQAVQAAFNKHCGGTSTYYDKTGHTVLLQQTSSNCD